MKKEKKKSGKKAKTDENCQEYCFKKHKTRFPELHYLIDNPSKEQVGDRYDNMFPSIKSSFSKVCSIEINGKAWGVISREFEAKVRPMLRAAIKAQLPGHDDGYIDYLTDHMIRNTVDHMVNTWDPNLAGGNGSGRSEWAAKGWANHRAVVGECIMDYLDRFKGMSRKEFNHLRDQGNIVRKKDGNFAVKYLVKETDIRDQAKYTDQFYSDNDDNLILKKKTKKQILSSLSTHNDDSLFFDSDFVFGVEIEPPIPPPTPPPEVTMALSVREIAEDFAKKEYARLNEFPSYEFLEDASKRLGIRYGMLHTAFLNEKAREQERECV